MSAPRRATRTNLFGLGRPTRRRSRGPTRRELAGQLGNARGRADRAIERLERARTEYELEEALRLGKHALRHLEATERKAVAGGVDEPGGGLLGVFGRGGSRPASGLARLIEQADDRLAVRREFERRARRRAIHGPEREREAAAREAKAAAARAERERERDKRAAERALQASLRKEVQQGNREEARRHAAHEREHRARERGRAREDMNAALRRAHTGRKVPRGRAREAPLEEGEDPAVALGIERNPARARARKSARR